MVNTNRLEEVDPVSNAVRNLEMSFQFYLNDAVPEDHEIRCLTDSQLTEFLNAVNDKYLPEIKKYRKAVRENNLENIDFNFLLYSVVLLGITNGEKYIFNVLRGEYDLELFDEE